jgi:hypothetical protein
MALILLAVAALLVHAQAEIQPPDAPFTVVSTRATVSSGEVIVSLGADRSRARLVRHAIVVTRSGAVAATLVRTRRVCEDLCPGSDDNGRVCHFEAVLRTPHEVADAIGVLPGNPDVRSVTVLQRGTQERISRSEEWIQAEPILGYYRWAQFPDGVYLSNDMYGRDFYAPHIALSACVATPVSTFTVLSCNGAELLYEGRRGIAASFADYSTQAALPEVRFRLNGRDAVLMRLALKAEVVIALLVHENGQWRMTVRGADHALIC